MTLSYWSEQGTEKEALIGAMMRELTREGHPYATDGGWGNWDLEVEYGLWGRMLVTVVAENHGADKRLLRVRGTPRFSPLSRGLVWTCGAAIAAGLILGMHWLAGFALVAAAGVAGVAGWQFRNLADDLHHVVEAAARDAQLTPVDPFGARRAI